MALIRWEPVPVNRLFNSLFDTATVQGAPLRRFATATDLIESDTHYLLRADLPGVSEDDISVELHDNVLTISGERKAQREERTAGYHRVERTSGSFHRSVRLPRGVDADRITANFDRGVLEISVPKPEQVTPRTVQITTNSTAPTLEPAAEAGSEHSEHGEPAREHSEPAAA
jgi:HSP20 family protein